MKKNCCIGKAVDKKLQDAVQFLKIIAEENRLKILCFLLHSEQCVGDIWNYLNLPQNLTSHHLKVLKNFGLIIARKEGLNVYYCVDHKVLVRWKKLLDSFLLSEKRNTERKKCC